MSQLLSISCRLQRIASYLPKSSHFADIGSDHAYLACYVCLNDPTAKAIAGEVVKGPYNSAKSTVNAYQLESAIDVRLGNGLAVLHKGEVKQVVIAGMGGALIQSILENGKKKIESVERIIVQPNVDEKSVRKWLSSYGYKIVQEEIIEENGHFYEIVVADYVGEVQNLTAKEIVFGPILLTEKSKIFYKKWESEQQKLRNVMKQLEQASITQTEKIKQFNTELAWIKEVLQDGQ
ncbi:tRNA (adenine(22)-N(1))-methyltransferase [Virgibacillus sp. DJP39]|uniref:tRNA (adenine(22)-N(1))-methyltransferase n=1 Tax=Virgibacillus sp. DJP39 TaxID=3409790 RepID=UPI003BB4B278